MRRCCFPIRPGRPRQWGAIGYVTVTLPIGGLGYGLLEVIWRGYTHPSMILTGGGCFAVICLLNRKLTRVPIAVRIALCTVVVILAEFLVGLLVNRVLDMNVWDYSGTRFHLLGQICLEYSFFWLLLCTVLSFAVSLFVRAEKKRGNLGK